MRKCSEELKKQVVAEYIAGEKTTARSCRLITFPKAIFTAGKRNMRLRAV